MVIRTAQYMAEINQAKENDSKQRKEAALEKLEHFFYFRINRENILTNNFLKVEISSGDYNLFNNEMEEILERLRWNFSDLGYKTTFSQDTENKENFIFTIKWMK